MKSFARDQNEPDPSHFQTPIQLCKILFTYSTILPGKSIDRRLLFDSVHVQAVGTKSERAGAEITTRGKLAIYLTCPLRQEVRANNFLEKISISENEKMIPPTP